MENVGQFEAVAAWTADVDRFVHMLVATVAFSHTCGPYGPRYDSNPGVPPRLAHPAAASRRHPFRSHIDRITGDFRTAATQVFLSVAFLADQARCMGDAIARTLVRVLLTRRHLLEWTTAAQSMRNPRLALAAFIARWRWHVAGDRPGCRHRGFRTLVLASRAALCAAMDGGAGTCVVGQWIALRDTATRRI